MMAESDGGLVKSWLCKKEKRERCMMIEFDNDKPLIQFLGDCLLYV